MTPLLLLLLPLLPDANAPEAPFSPDRCGLVRSMAPLGRHLHGVVFSPDGGRVAVGAGSVVVIYETRGWSEVLRLDAPVQRVLSLAWNRRGTRLAAGGLEGRIALLDPDGGRPRILEQETAGYVSSVAFSPDGRRLLSTTFGGGARVWPVEESGSPRVLEGAPESAMGAAFSPDGRHVAVAGSDGSLQLWSAKKWSRIGTFTGIVSPRSVWFSRNGREVGAVWSGGVRAWPVDGGGGPGRDVVKAPGVTTAAFMPDGRHLVLGTTAGPVRIHDRRRGEAEASLDHHVGPVNGVAAAPDGSGFVTVGQDGHVKVWGRVAPGVPRLRPKGFLGIKLQNDAAGQVVIVEVIAGTAADRAGIRAGDVLRSVGGVEIGDWNRSIAKISSYFAGDRVEIGIFRGTDEKTFRVTLGRRPDALPE